MDYESSNTSVNVATNNGENEIRLIDSYLNLLEHIETCQMSQCSLPKCDAMKRIKIHATTCQRHNRQCEFCRQFLSLCLLHAKRCSNQQCRVPFCFKIKLKLENLKEFKQRTQRTNEQLDLSNQSNDAKEIAAIERMLSSFVF